MKAINLSPLRYPGGKSRMFDSIRRIITKNRMSRYIYIEPFAGGANVALNLLFNNCIKKIHINDFDRSIYAFWYSILNYTEEFVKRVITVEITIDEWNKQKIIQENKDEADLLNLGFSTFFLNRTNRSGIINAGPIGGKNQEGSYDIDCRFNRLDLVHRIITISKMKQSIHISNLDAKELMKQFDNDIGIIWYLDPPYYNKGSELYMNFYEHEDHLALEELIRLRKHIIVSYDDTKEIKKIFTGYKYRKYSLIHNVSNKGHQNEIMFFSKDLSIPNNLFAKRKDNNSE